MSYKVWRLTHRYAFSNWKWLMTISSIILIIISITGIVLIHEHDTQFFAKTRVPTSILPDSYQTKLDNMRAAQGITTHYKKDADSVPLSWLMYDLHSGEFFGKWAWIYYDLISVALIVMSVTGVYMFFVLINSERRTKKRKEAK